MKFFNFILIIFFVSCAKPNYVENQEVVSREVVSSCDHIFSSEELCMNFKWAKMPTESEFGLMKVQFTDFKDDRIFTSPKRHFHFHLWMSSMGHGSSPVEIKEISPGKFEISKIFFIMPGPWDMHFQLKDEDHVQEEFIQKITI